MYNTHTYDCRVLSFRRILPAGSVAEGEPNSLLDIRKEHLVEVYTDPGGKRVLAAASVHLKDPGRKKKQ